MSLNDISGVFILLFILLVLAVGVISIFAAYILFKHAEKRSVAVQMSLVYIVIFLFLLLGAFARVGVI